MASSFWDTVRRDFSSSGSALYLDHAAGGPIPRPVEEALLSYNRENAVEADFAWPKWMRRAEEARAEAAKFINADPSEIAFVHGTSQAMNLIAELLSRSGAVLTNTCEFPSSTIPWLSRKAKIVFQSPENNEISLRKLESLLSPPVKTIVTSYVQYATGFRQDMDALGKLKKGRYLVVNATQALGALQIDVKKWNADFLCSNSYKWLMAGYGGGILYVRKKWLAKFPPLSAGWRSVDDPEAMNNRKYRIKRAASRYEFGCPSFGTIFAVGAACRYLSQIGKDKIEKRILSLTGYAINSLEKNGFEVLSRKEEKSRSGIVIFKADPAEKIWKRLIAQKVFVSARGSGLRLAPHFYNTYEEIDRFIKKLKACRDKETGGVR